MALCRRTRQVVANAYGDRSARTCAQLWSRIPRSDSSGDTAKAEASAISGSPQERQLLPVFEEDPTHQQVGKPSGELAHVGRFFGNYVRKWLDISGERERPLSQNECCI